MISLSHLIGNIKIKVYPNKTFRLNAYLLKKPMSCDWKDEHTSGFFVCCFFLVKSNIYIYIFYHAIKFHEQRSTSMLTLLWKPHMLRNVCLKIIYLPHNAKVFFCLKKSVFFRVITWILIEIVSLDFLENLIIISWTFCLY